jgi:hypothetical protein
MNPGRASSIFNITRQEVGWHALKLVRSIEKSAYKLEAHHRHLNFTHRALENRWFPKSLRFNPPGSHPIFRTIMERATTHCMRARISICHEQIRSTNRIIADNGRELSTLISDDSLTRFSQFLKSRTESVQNRITARHQKSYRIWGKNLDPETRLTQRNGS